MLKEVLIGTGCFAAGGAAGFFICKKLMTEQMYAAVDAEVSKQIQEYKYEAEKKQMNKDLYNQEVAEEIPEVSDDEKKVEEDYHTHSSLENRPDPQEKVNYSALYDKKHDKMPSDLFGDNAEKEHPHDDGEHAEDMTDDEKLEAEGQQLNDEIAGDKKLNKEPFIITEDQFSNEYNMYDKETLYYYNGDDVVADEFDTVVEDVHQLLGNCLSEINWGRDGTAYVRNHKLGTDYEINWMEGSYSELFENELEADLSEEPY